MEKFLVMQVSPFVCALAIFTIMITLFIGCGDTNKWEIRQTVKPEVLNQLSNKIAIKYNLGPFLILDDIDLENEAQAIYIFKTKDLFELDVVVKYADTALGTPGGFYYYFNDTKIGGFYGTKPIALSKLQAAEHEIDGFKWLEREEESLEESVKIPENESVEEKEVVTQSEKSL